MEVKLANLEKKYKSLISFHHKTLNLFQSFVEYNQMIVSEFLELKQMSNVFELELDESQSELYENGNYNDSIDNNVLANNQSNDFPFENTVEPVNDNYQPKDFPFENTVEPVNDNYQPNDFPFENTVEPVNDNYQPNDFPFKNEAEGEFAHNSAYMINGSTLEDSTMADESINNVDKSGTDTNDNLLHEDGEYKCIHCKYKTKRLWNMNRHKRNFHKEALQCNITENRTRPEPYPTHNQASEEKIFHCSQCTLRFTSNRNLMVHQRIHTGEKPFACDICNIKFNYQYSLKRHQREKQH